jgi:hypothetical protein
MPRGGRRSTSFRPGVSGNPGGRPRRPDTIATRQIFVNVRAAARALTQEAIGTLAAVMRDGRAPPTARISAAVALLDRGHGRPPQTAELNVGYDLARLTDDELETLEPIMERATLPSPKDRTLSCAQHGLGRVLKIDDQFLILRLLGSTAIRPNNSTVNETKSAMTIDCLQTHAANIRGGFDADIVVWQRNFTFW